MGRVLKDVYTWGWWPVLGGRVMWFWYMGVNQVALGQCFLESEFVCTEGLRC